MLAVYGGTTGEVACLHLPPPKSDRSAADTVLTFLPVRANDECFKAWCDYFP